MDRFDHLPPASLATADRPLAGLTVLLVEDSRLASEGVRLLCTRSGARLRRADTLLAAGRHLRAYRPGAVIVDIHLPDGSGLDLIRHLAQFRPRIPAILATSGDPAQAWAAAQAGADGFLAKPLPDLVAFQAALLAFLPPDSQPPTRHPLPPGSLPPDPQALRDDLARAASLLADDRPSLEYVAGFVGGVARSAGDEPLARAAKAAAMSGTPATLAQALRQRLDARPAF